MNIRNPKALLGVLYASAFIGAFNENAVNTALVDIMAEHNVSATTSQWLVTGYMLVSTIIVALSAFLYRRLSLRTLFYSGVGFLAVGLVGSMLATSWPTLLVTRLIQAIGTGVFIPIMMTTVLIVAPKAQTALYLSIGGAMITFGPALAPVVTGALVTSFGWRAAFLPGLVIVVLVALVGLRFVHNVTENEKLSLDIPSVILAILGLFFLVYGLSQVSIAPLLGICCVLVALAVLAIFARRQFSIDNPMLNLRPLLNRKFWPALILLVVAMITSFSMSVLLPLYFQSSFGMTAFLAGFLLLIPIVVNAFTSVIGGRVMDSRGPWPLLFAGMILIAIGQVLNASTAQVTWILVLVGSIIAYAGVGLTMSPSQSAGLASLPPEDNPHGVALMNSFIQIAGSIGPSLFIGIMSSQAEPAAGFSRAVAFAASVGILGVITAFFYTRRWKHSQEPDTTAAQAPVLTAADIAHDPSYSIDAEASVRKAVEILIDKRISGMPVTRDHRVIGFLSDSDILHALDTDISYWLANISQEKELSQRMQEVMDYTVADVATMHVVSVTPETTLEEAAAVFGKTHFKKIPVVRDGLLVSSISRADVTRRLIGTVLAKDSLDV